MIVETSGWRHLKEKNELFLSYEYKKMYHPSQEMAQLSCQVPFLKRLARILRRRRRARFSGFVFVVLLVAEETHDGHGDLEYWEDPRGN